MTLLTSLVGVTRSFYHHWKGLLNLHGISCLEISFLANLLFAENRSKVDYDSIRTDSGDEVARKLQGLILINYFRYYNTIRCENVI